MYYRVWWEGIQHPKWRAPESPVDCKGHCNANHEWCFRLFSSPLPDPGVSVCSLNQRRSLHPRDAQRPKQPSQVCEPTDFWTAEICCWTIGGEKILRNLIFDECKTLLVKATVCRLAGGGKQNNNWKRSISGQFFCLNISLLLLLRRLWRWCSACVPFLV